MDRFDTSRNELQVGGLPLSLLAERVGQTPFYAYDRALIAARIHAVRQVLPPGVRLHYAVKANPMPALVGWVRPLVDGMDVASAGELKLALDAGADAQAIGFAGPGKRAAELRQAVAAGVLLHVESARELRVLADAAQALGRPARVALRINPDFELRGAGMHMGGGPKPFGIDAEQVPALLRGLAHDGLAFEGLSCRTPARRICGAKSLHRACADHSIWCCVWRTMPPHPCAMSTWGAAGAYRIFRVNGRWTWPPWPMPWRRCRRIWRVRNLRRDWCWNWGAIWWARRAFMWRG